MRSHKYIKKFTDQRKQQVNSQDKCPILSIIFNNLQIIFEQW